MCSGLATSVASPFFVRGTDHRLSRLSLLATKTDDTTRSSVLHYNTGSARFHRSNQSFKRRSPQAPSNRSPHHSTRHRWRSSRASGNPRRTEQSASTDHLRGNRGTQGLGLPPLLWSARRESDHTRPGPALAADRTTLSHRRNGNRADASSHSLPDHRRVRQRYRPSGL
jgi:hypothetical protein